MEAIAATSGNGLKPMLTMLVEDLGQAGPGQAAPTPSQQERAAAALNCLARWSLVLELPLPIVVGCGGGAETAEGGAMQAMVDEAVMGLVGLLSRALGVDGGAGGGPVRGLVEAVADFLEAAANAGRLTTKKKTGWDGNAAIPTIATASAGVVQRALAAHAHVAAGGANGAAAAHQPLQPLQFGASGQDAEDEAAATATAACRCLAHVALLDRSWTCTGSAEAVTLLQGLVAGTGARPVAAATACVEVWAKIDPGNRRAVAEPEGVMGGALHRELLPVLLQRAVDSLEAASAEEDDEPDEDEVEEQEKFREQVLAEGLRTCYEVLRGAYLQALVPAIMQDASAPHAEAALFATRVVALDAGRRACLKTGSPTAKNAICRACNMSMETLELDIAATDAALHSIAVECVGAGGPAPRPWFNTRGAVVASMRLMGLMAKWYTAHLTGAGAGAAAAVAAADAAATEARATLLTRAALRALEGLSVPAASNFAAECVRNLCSRSGGAFAEPGTLQQILATLERAHEASAGGELSAC